MIARAGVLGPDSMLCVITPSSSRIIAPVRLIPPSFSAPPKIVFLAQLSKSSSVLTSSIIENASNKAFNILSSLSFLAILSMDMIDSFVSSIDCLVASSTVFLLFLPRPSSLNESDFTNLAFFVSYNAVSIVSTSCLAGPSISCISTISAISLPATPKSRTCLRSEPTTRSAITTFLDVHISIPSTMSGLASSNSFRYSCGDMSIAFLPCVIR